MADDINVLDAASATKTVAADEVASKLYQRIKLVHGADGVNAGDVAAGNPLPVVQTGTPALPTGAASAANQTTELASLASIDGKLPASPATAGNQTTANASLASIDTKADGIATRLAEGAPVTGESLEAGGSSGTGWLSSIRKAVTAITTLLTARLPAALGTSGGVKVSIVDGATSGGDASAANQVTGNASLAAIEASAASLDTAIPNPGQAAMAASIPVVIASNQSAVPVADGGGSLTVDGTVAATQSGTWTEANSAAIKTAAESLDAAIPNAGQAAMAASVPVAIASDQSAVPVSGTVTANVGTVGTLATAAKQDTLAALVGEVQASPTANTLLDRLKTIATNLGAVVIAAGANVIGAVTQSGTWTVQPGNTANTTPWLMAGGAAHGATVAGNPVLGGGEARDANGTAVTAGQAVRQALDRYGRTRVVKPKATSQATSNGTPITATTANVIAAPSAGSHLRMLRLHVANGGATATWVSFREGAAGLKKYAVCLPQYGVISPDLGGSWELPSATSLDIVLSAAGSVEYTLDYEVVVD